MRSRRLPMTSFGLPAPTRPLRDLALRAALLALAAGCGGGSNAEEKPTSRDLELALPEKNDSSSAVSPSAGGPPAGRGAWTAVSRGDIKHTHPAIGIFRAAQTTRLGSQVSGRVEEVLADVGDKVHKDQELLRLEAIFFEIEVAQRKADVEAAKVEISSAELDFRRMQNLWDKPEGQEPSIPKKSFDDAKSRLDAATARLKQAQEALREAQERLAECTIRAPYDAVITERLVDPGEPVTSAPVTHLLELQQVDLLELEFSLSQPMLSRVGPGTRVYFEVEGIEGSDGAAEISTVFPALQEATRSFRCRAFVKNSDGKLRPGLLVKVRVVDGGAKDALVIPRKAIVPGATGPQVLVRDDDQPVRRGVKTGLEEGDRLQVLEGLSEGEKVWVPQEGSSE